MINLQKYLYGLFNGSLKPLIRKVKPLSFKRDGDNLALRLVPSGTYLKDGDLTFSGYILLTLLRPLYMLSLKSIWMQKTMP